MGRPGRRRGPDELRLYDWLLGRDAGGTAVVRREGGSAPRLGLDGPIAFVGAGGKTSALFWLAAQACQAGLRVLACTTTRMIDPRGEGRALDVWLDDPSWSGLDGVSRPPLAPAPRAEGFLAFACPGVEGGKALGLQASVVDAAAKAWDLVLCEADGARRLPLKAPAEHEPVVPPSSSLVVALMGLDAIGRPLNESEVCRSELIARICGGPLGRAIDAEDLRTLAVHPDGAFKCCPRNARRFLILNKAELVDPNMAQALAASIRRAYPGLRVGLANAAKSDEIDERER